MELWGCTMAKRHAHLVVSIDLVTHKVNTLASHTAIAPFKYLEKSSFSSCQSLVGRQELFAWWNICGVRFSN